MPLPLIANTVRITYRGSLPSGTQWANVMHARYFGASGSPTTTDIAAAESNLRRLYVSPAFAGGDYWLHKCGTLVTLIDATCYVLNGTSVPQVMNISANGSQPTPIQQVPQECAAVLTLRSDKRGRSYRGRVYLPAWDRQNSDAQGNLTTGATTGTVAQAQALQTALVGISWEWVVASYLHSTAERVTTFTMDTRPDVQRRRKR